MKQETPPNSSLIALLPILVCPVCKNDLLFNPRENNLSCPVCSLRYRINDGVPDLLAEDAEEI